METTLQMLKRKDISKKGNRVYRLYREIETLSHETVAQNPLVGCKQPLGCMLYRPAPYKMSRYLLKCIHVISNQKNVRSLWSEEFHFCFCDLTAEHRVLGS